MPDVLLYQSEGLEAKLLYKIFYCFTFQSHGIALPERHVTLPVVIHHVESVAGYSFLRIFEVTYSSLWVSSVGAIEVRNMQGQGPPAASGKAIMIT